MSALDNAIMELPEEDRQTLIAKVEAAADNGEIDLDGPFDPQILLRFILEIAKEAQESESINQSS